VVAHGRLGKAQAGHRLALEYAVRPGAWRTVVTTRVHRDGAYRVTARLRRNGALRVHLVPASQAAQVRSAAAVSGGQAGKGRPVGVAARLTNAQHTKRVVQPGRRIKVKGRLLPAAGGRHVRLQAKIHNRWRTVARARTRRHGTFVLRWTVSRAGATR